MFQKKSYDAVRTMLQDKDCKWVQYVNRLLDEVDPHVLKMTALNLGFEAAYFGTKTIREKRKELQCQVPWLILMDPTSACNLHCTGCWAAEYGHKLNLSYEELDSIVTQGKELGIYFYMYDRRRTARCAKADLITLCVRSTTSAHSTAYHQRHAGGSRRCAMRWCVSVTCPVSISLEGFEEANDSRRGAGCFTTR